MTKSRKASNPKTTKENKPRNSAKGKQLGSHVAGPWQRKYYVLNLKKFDINSETFIKAPPQVKQLLKFMKHHSEEIEKAGGWLGSQIADEAIKRKWVVSKLEPAVLFAYYRRLMEAMGLEMSRSESSRAS